MHIARRNQTGVGDYSVQLLHHLYNEADIEVEAILGWNVFERGQNLPNRIARQLFDLFWTNIFLPAELARKRVDVLHAPAYIAPIWGSCPLIVTVHDTISRLFPSHYAGWWVKYTEWLLPRILKRASAVITVSEHSKQDIIRTYGVDPSRVRVIYPAVDHARYNPGAGSDSGRVMKHYGIPGEYVLHVGALVTRKNIPLLLEAVGILKDRGKWGNRRLILAGPKAPGMPGVKEVEETIARLQLEKDVVITGHVPAEWLPGLYAGASIFAFPSLYEGFGTPPIEAMACGVPVVATAGSAVSEVVGSAGLLVPGNDKEAFAEAMLSVLENPAVQEDLRARGLQRAATFTWQHTAQQTVDLYQEVAGSVK